MEEALWIQEACDRLGIDDYAEKDSLLLMWLKLLYRNGFTARESAEVIEKWLQYRSMRTIQ